MAAPIKDSLLLLCLVAVTAHALDLPALKRQNEQQEKAFLARHAHLRTTRRPLVLDSQPGSLDRGITAPPSGIRDNVEPEENPEPQSKPQPQVDLKDDLESEQWQEPEPELRPDETEPEPEPKLEFEPEEPKTEPQLVQETAPEQKVKTLDESPVQTLQPGEPAEKQGMEEAEAAPAGPSSRQMAPQTQQVDQPNVINSEQMNSMKVEETTITPEPVTFEAAPDNAYAVFDHHGRICILATLSADMEIIYYNEYDERKKVTVGLPDDAVVTGACARDNAKPRINLRWDNFQFSMLFTENDIGNTWYVSDMTLEYDAGQFAEAKPGAGRQSLWMDQQMQHTLHLFGTPVDKAYFCTSKQDLDLYNGDGVRSATVVLWDLHLQPYVRDGQFGASVNCPGVPVGRRRINETVPMAVGSTLAAVTVLTIAGYALWRHVKVKKFNYDTME